MAEGQEGFVFAADCLLAFRRDERPNSEDEIDRAWIGAALWANRLRRG